MTPSAYRMYRGALVRTCAFLRFDARRRRGGIAPREGLQESLERMQRRMLSLRARYFKGEARPVVEGREPEAKTWVVDEVQDFAQESAQAITDAVARMPNRPTVVTVEVKESVIERVFEQGRLW